MEKIEFVYAKNLDNLYYSLGRSLNDGEVDSLIRREEVRGERFVHPQKGIDVCIGLSEDVRRFLAYYGSHFEEVEKLYTQIDTLKSANQKLIEDVRAARESEGNWTDLYGMAMRNLNHYGRRLNQYDGMSIWQKILFLFGNHPEPETYHNEQP